MEPGSIVVAVPKMDEGPIWSITDYFIAFLVKAWAQPDAVGWGSGGQGLTFLVGANHLKKAAATMDATMQRISGDASMT